MELFDFPAPWDESLEKSEPGAPDSIRHHCDYMLHDTMPGVLEFHYNFFVYHWSVGDKVFHARAYSDTFGEVAVFLPFAELRKTKYEPIVAWLKRRFAMIQTHEVDAGVGYVTRWKLRATTVSA